MEGPHGESGSWCEATTGTSWDAYVCSAEGVAWTTTLAWSPDVAAKASQQGINAVLSQKAIQARTNAQCANLRRCMGGLSESPVILRVEMNSFVKIYFLLCALSQLLLASLRLFRAVAHLVQYLALQKILTIDFHRVTTSLNATQATSRAWRTASECSLPFVWQLHLR